MSSERRKLLLADDSPTIQKVISLTFGEDEGFEVVAVGNGAQALRALTDDPPPDVVLADVVMPGPDGYELCERIKRDARLNGVPVVLLVGTFEPFNEAEARRVGADTVLTKPFQSIRNLVGKVGALLGGEPKADESAPAQVPGDERSFEEARHESEVRHAAEFDASEEPQVVDPAASFADLGADDELIEARPAEAFTASPAFARRRSDASTHEEAPEPDSQAAPAALAVEGEPEPVFAAAHSRESVMTEPTAPQTSFEARAASASAVDDALLDLGQLGAPAAVATAEADDFILDLGFDDEPVAEPVAEVFESPVEESSVQTWADAPSAFAEAAHGEPEPSPSHEETPWRDVVVQDGPQGFAFSGEEPEVVEAAPRGFVEPEVVPADEPVPAVVAAEFTDGSVEGDLPRPQEPSTAGYAVGEARTGVEEPMHADQFTPEAIDQIARRVVEMMSDKVVREIAWEVVPELAELLIKQKLEEERRS